MKALTLLLPALAALATAGTAHAETAPGEVQILAQAHQKCRLDPQVRLRGAATNLGALSSTGLSLADLTAPDVAAARPAQVQFAFSGFCNGPHRLVLESANNGLWRTGSLGAAANLAQSTPYTVGARWSDRPLLLNADARSRRRAEAILHSNAPAGGALEISFTIDANASGLGDSVPLAAGRYSDLLRISLEPGE